MSYVLRLFLPFIATSLVNLCKSRDPETQRLALQTLELLAIENADVIILHVSTQKCGWVECRDIEKT